MLRIALIAVATITTLAGCASEIMKSYVGEDITKVYLDYGPPQNQFKLPDGRIAFQWVRDVGMVMPTTTTITNYGTTATANTYGGGVYSWTCAYTLYAKPNNQDSYTVVGYEPPRADCE